MKRKKPSISQTMTNSPGGMQAGRDINIKTDIPEPKISHSIVVQNKPTDGLFVTQFLITIDAKVPINNLSLRVNAATIVRLEAVAQKTGISISGNSGVREGWAFTNLQQAYGSYLITVITRSPESLDVVYDF